MVWRLEFKRKALNQLEALEPIARVRILEHFRERVIPLVNPRQQGAALQGKKYEGLWRYRVGDYRIIAEIKDGEVTILVIEIGHRRDVYR